MALSAAALSAEDAPDGELLAASSNPRASSAQEQAAGSQQHRGSASTGIAAAGLSAASASSAEAAAAGAQARAARFAGFMAQVRRLLAAAAARTQAPLAAQTLQLQARSCLRLTHAALPAHAEPHTRHLTV
jgi:hypothetical protein